MIRAIAGWLADLSIRYKLRLAILSTTAFAVLLVAIATATVHWYNARASATKDLGALAEVVAANSTAAISFNDRVAAGEILQALRTRGNVVVACLFAGAGAGREIAALYQPSTATGPDCQRLLRQGPDAVEGFITASADVVLDGETLGELVIVENDAAIWSLLKANLAALLVISLLSMVLAALLSSVIERLISRPIIALADTADQIADSSDFSLRAPPSGKDEVGGLIRAFNFMLDQIEAAEINLRELNADLQLQVAERNRANATLQEALDQLKETQDQLVQTEKMASLGGLVAGVAHEINTPIGVGVTAASTLKSRSEEMRIAFEQEELTASGLHRYFDMVGQSTSILLTNLERAANLIQSFKQVAVDQTSPEIRAFRLAEYIHEILLSLRPKLKKTHIEVRLECDPDLCIRSYPGVLSQVLTNLVMNALTHAYGPNDTGTIVIHIEPIDGGLRLLFRDDGAGIPTDAVPHIFDPFFTTRRNAGGSGLGLHIVYNLVTQQLGGRIRVHSEVGMGTEFTIDMKSKESVHEHTLARTG